MTERRLSAKPDRRGVMRNLKVATLKTWGLQPPSCPGDHDVAYSTNMSLKFDG